ALLPVEVRRLDAARGLLDAVEDRLVRLLGVDAREVEVDGEARFDVREIVDLDEELRVVPFDLDLGGAAAPALGLLEGVDVEPRDVPELLQAVAERASGLGGDLEVERRRELPG